MTGARRRGWRATSARLRSDARTVRVRTTAGAVLVLGVSLIGSCVVLVLLLGSTLVRESGVAAQGRAHEVAEAVTRAGGPSGVEIADAEDRFVQVVDQRGKVVASNAGIAGRPALPRVAPGRTRRLTSPLSDGGEAIAAAAVAQTPDGPFTVVAGASLEDARDSARVAAGLLAAGVPLLLVVVGITTWVVVGRALAPVEAIRAEVDGISADQLHRRVGQGGGENEVTRLAATMNRMLVRLEQSQQRQRRFVSDASHELRSPVASIRQHAEVALAHPDRGSVAELAATVLAEDRRIEQLIENLLLLARADESGGLVAPRPVDLDDLVLEQASRVRAVGLIDVDLSAVSAGRVSGVPALLSRLVGNLVENAARHARSRIALTVQELPEESAVLLRVDDDGPGIPAPQRQRVFERFVRLDDARSRDGGGAGLGLAIAAEVAHLHGGTIEAGTSPLGGARLQVRLPLSDD